jgi:stearoyl-CoA desaturase (delta-9 desaturase)
VFFAAYLVNTTMISVFYHRGLAHGAVRLTPSAQQFVGRYGVWATGLDPKAWVCMHRAHHDFSDSEDDPHSPVHYGFFGVLLGQLRSYERILVCLIRGDEKTTQAVADLDFPVSWPNRTGYWYAPYLVHLAVAVLIALPTGMWALGAAYWIGIMSHPFEGWIVNSFGHAVGSRNFETTDNSRNNHLAAWLVVGEGFQNNHHRFPASAKFSFAVGEVDFGYGLCLALERTGVLEIARETLIPSREEFVYEEAARTA